MPLPHPDPGHHMAPCAPAIVDTDVHRFAADVVEASRQCLVIVDLWADWCGPCHVLTPVLNRVLVALGDRVRLVKVEVDADDNMKIAGRYGARGFPTVLLFKAGELVDRFHGAKPEHFVREFIARHLAA